jgi:type IV pilus assembly protein PilB
MNSVREKINISVLNAVSSNVAKHYRVIPFKQEVDCIFFYADETELTKSKIDELELLIGKKAVITKISPTDIHLLLEKYYASSSDSRQQLNYYTGEAEHFLKNLIAESKAMQSSDIHIETFEEKCRVRLRIDGLLIQRYLLDKKQYPGLINKIKIISNLDISEKRLPQDGRIFFESANEKFDIRVSILPTLFGEKIVLRILNNNASNIELSDLGFSTLDLYHYHEGIRKPNGLLLISGPTGSGKTTTLYATLKELNKDTRNILTIEDPIEYTLEGINQVQLRENIGLTFAAALRTFLRQDPDVIMLGEIRDAETANMAIRAALTGHLVLSTIHTNSAWGIVSRLIDMGVAPYLLANTLNTAVAQRLLRLLCTKCKKKVLFDNSLYPKRFKPYSKVEYHYISVGCNDCFNTGFKGRKAVYEVLPIDGELAELIKNTSTDIENTLTLQNIKTLSKNAFEIFANGQTSLDEIYSLLMN